MDPDQMTPEFVEIGNWAMLVERGLEPNVAKRITKQYMDKCVEVEKLRAALNRSMIAIDDWLNTYAPDLCDEARLAEAETRIAEMGTLAYIAEVQQQNRAALEQNAQETK